jgi:CDP-6-deoxy-D-xylo-4-hexulose-3-dehydrase
MSTIEGGMVTTDDRELYNIMISLRSHGWLRDNDADYREKTFNKYNMDDAFLANYYFVFPGLNIRNTDLSAYVGRNQLKKIDSFVVNRSDNYNRFIDKLENHVWVQRSDTDPVSSLAFGIIHENRIKIAEELINNDVECRPLICGSIQEHPFWYTRYEKVHLPNATKVHKEGLYVPCHQNLSSEQVDFISNIILDNV